MTTKNFFATGVALLALGYSAQATNYAGNGNSGFGGAIGQGGSSALTLTDDGTTLFGTVNRGPGTFNNALVIYLDSVSGGFSSTAGFNDNGDGLRQAISGYTANQNNGNPGQSVLTFASGFVADYALALGPDSDNFGGLWSLANGGGNSLGFISSANLTPTGTAIFATYTFSINLAAIGVTPGNSFKLFGSYISNSGFRSDEALAGNDSGTQGWNPFTQTSFGTYTVAAVPEPTTLALAGSGLALLVGLRRRK